VKVFEVMTSRVVTVAPDAPLALAARLMKEADVGPLPVCEGRRVVGILTDRDITVRATADGRDPNTTRVDEVMTPEAVCCLESDDVQRAAAELYATMRAEIARRGVSAMP
jgi:CBS domain-containing protein